MMKANLETVSLDSKKKVMKSQKIRRQCQPAYIWIGSVYFLQYSTYHNYSLLTFFHLENYQGNIKPENVHCKTIIIAIAGVFSYIVNFFFTIYLAWDLNYVAFYREGFLLLGKSVELLLYIIEPIQISYSAVVCLG